MLARRSQRIQKEIQQFMQDPPDHIFIDVNDENLAHVEILFIGPRYTPYSRMFLRFSLDFPEAYPIKPPKVVFSSSYNKKIHPNIFPGGWICLSTLNTGDDAGWVPSINLTALLATLYSMFSKEMIEIDNTHSHEKSDKFFPAVMFDTFTITAKLLKDERNAALKEIMDDYLEDHRDWYLRKLDKLAAEHDGQDLPNYYISTVANFKGLKKFF